MIGHAEAWDIGIYANPNYYFQYDSQEFRDAYANALEGSQRNGKSQMVRPLPGNRRRGCRQRISLSCTPALSAMKIELMGWWENYPTIAMDCSEVWWKK